MHIFRLKLKVLLCSEPEVTCSLMCFILEQDTFFRYLKSPVYKEIQKKAITPEPHNFR